MFKAALFCLIFAINAFSARLSDDELVERAEKLLRDVGYYFVLTDKDRKEYLKQAKSKKPGFSSSKMAETKRQAKLEALFKNPMALAYFESGRLHAVTSILEEKDLKGFEWGVHLSRIYEKVEKKPDALERFIKILAKLIVGDKSLA